MKKISREKFEYYKQKHYELWDWLANHPDKKKGDQDGWYETKLAKHFCFACEAADEIRDGGDLLPCMYCPITEKEHLFCCNGLYYAWCHLQHKSEFAKCIRDMPQSEEYVEDWDEKLGKV